MGSGAHAMFVARIHGICDRLDQFRRIVLVKADDPVHQSPAFRGVEFIDHFENLGVYGLVLICIIIRWLPPGFIDRIADGFILQLADPQILKWTLATVRQAAAEAGRDPDELTVAVVAPAYVGDNLEHQRDQLRWFGGMVGNHVVDLVNRYGAEDESKIPRALSNYIKAREEYDYAHHGKAGNPTTDFVPDEIVDRFCILGPIQHHIDRLVELHELGVDHFSIYLMHDEQEATLDAYGEYVVPYFEE